MPATPACQSIRDAIETIKLDIRDFQRMLRTATPAEKKDIAAAIKALQEELERKEQALRDCLMNWWGAIKNAPPVR